MARPSLPLCPNCGRKLPYDRNTRVNQKGERERIRQCSCGYTLIERVTVAVHEYFPESHVCDEPKHPGEGGYGYGKPEND